MSADNGREIAVTVPGDLDEDSRELWAQTYLQLVERGSWDPCYVPLLERYLRPCAGFASARSIRARPPLHAR